MTTTTYLELDDQATGANNNTWGDVNDANMAIIEQAIARYVGISTTGGTTTLTSAQNRYPIIRLTGVLVSNAIIVVRTAEKNWHFINATTGAFTVTVKTSAGTGKTLPRGRAVKLYCDGTNVEYARAHGIPAAQAGGTVDAITATFEPATTSAEIQDGTLWIIEAAGANTSTTPTFNPDATGALTIKKNGGQALAAGDIRAAGHKLLLCYDSSGGHVELLNPSFSSLARTDTANTFTANQVIEVTDNTNAALRITQLGTGLALRIEDSANPDSTPVVVDASGKVGIGTASPSGALEVKGTDVLSYVWEAASSYKMVLRGFSSNTPFYSLREDGAARVALDFDCNAQSVVIKTAATDRFKVDSSGNVLNISTGGLGYGTGSGGTVTQLTSKSTGVTLNKTNGQIITHNAALASVTEVAFTVTNSTVAATDTVIVSKVSGGTSIRYEVFIGAMAAGSFDVVIRNISGSSASDVLTINFAVIKAVTS